EQNVAIVIVRGLEARKMRLDTVDRHRKAADPVAVGTDEVGKAHVRPPFALGDLLAQEGDAHVALLLLEVDDDIVAVAPTWPEPCDAARMEPAFGDDRLEHCARVGKEVARALADNLVVKD